MAQGALVPVALVWHAQPGFTPDLKIRGELETLLAAPKKGEQLTGAVTWGMVVATTGCGCVSCGLMRRR